MIIKNVLDEFDELIFNDADGTDEDLKHHEWLSTTLYESDCNAWDDPIFFVGSTEGGYSIIYDDQKKDVRYSIIISLRIDARDLYDGSILFVTQGKSWKGEVGQEYKYARKIEMPNKFTYQYFLDVDDEKIKISSIDKVVRLANKFLNLRVFT